MVNIPIVTLDKIYIESDNENIVFLDCTRVNSTNEIISRRKESIEEQINNIINKFCGKKVFIADDVVFSGNVLRIIIDKLTTGGVDVVGVISSISTRSGYEYFKCLKYGLKTNYIMEDDVIDQICERDFYFGIAGSGIMIREDDSYYKAPYFKPFGNPNERASIPVEYEDSFSKECLRRSIVLWEEMERLGNREIFAYELPEVIYGVNKGDNVVKKLKKEMNKLCK